MSFSPELHARTRTVTLVGAIETRLRAEDYGPETAALVAELVALESRFGYQALTDGMPALLARYSVVLQAWREVTS